MIKLKFVSVFRAGILVKNVTALTIDCLDIGQPTTGASRTDKVYIQCRGCPGSLGYLGCLGCQGCLEYLGCLGCLEYL